MDLDMALGRSPGLDDTMASGGSTGHSNCHDIVLGYKHGLGLDVSLVPGGSPDPWHVLQWYHELRHAP